MIDGEDKTKLINVNETFASEQIRPEPIQFNNEPRTADKNNIIHNTLIKLFSLLLVLSTLSLILEILTVSFISSQLLNYLFKYTWWVSLPCTLFIIILIVLCYVYQTNSYVFRLSGVIFFIYLILLLALLFVLSLNFIKILLSITILIAVGIIFLLGATVFNEISNKYLTKLLILYAYSLIHFVVHIIVVKNNYVEFFILIVVVLLYFAYLNSEIRKIFIEHLNVEENKDNISTSFILIIVIIIPIDMFLSPFK